MSREPFIPLVGGGGQVPEWAGAGGTEGSHRDVGVSLCMQQPAWWRHLCIHM